jgi:OFA family oxalate/formate antiporter-like MFS transporter
MAASSVPVLETEPRVVNRWVQMCAGIVAMMAIANLQYAWTLFTKPLTSNFHTTLAAVQVAFAAFIFAETWLVPFEGYLVDRLGPRLLIAIGGVLVGAGWIGSGYAQSLRAVIVWYTIGGIGAGAVYGACVGNVLKWFPDHRGLCAGIVSGAYGIGTAATIAPIATMIKTAGYQKTFITWGLIQGTIVVLAAIAIVKPPSGWLPKGWHPGKVPISGVDMTWTQMLGQPSFYIIYVMMTMVAFGGLVVTAQINPIATFYGVDKVMIAWGMSALVLAIQLNRIVNGITRPFWGWVSDHIGRANAMFFAFFIEGVAVYGLLQTRSKPVLFILLSSVVFFAWGEIFSLFPSITADLYGRKWATTNYGIVYTAKGTAAIFAGPVAAMASMKSGSWVSIFYAMIACDIVAAFMALLWLKPFAKRTIDEAEKMAAEAAAKAKPKAAAAATGR